MATQYSIKTDEPTKQEHEELFQELIMGLSPEDRAQIVKALRDQLTPEQHAELEMMRKEGRL